METVVQLVTKVDDELAAAIDALVAAGEYESRSDVVRRGVSELIERERRAAIGRTILAGYESVPETDAEVRFAEQMSRAMIAEEPW